MVAEMSPNKNSSDINLSRKINDEVSHELRTPREEIAFPARLKIQSQSQIFRYGRSIFCLPNWPNFSDIFDLCLHWVSVVRDLGGQTVREPGRATWVEKLSGEP